MNNLHEKCTFSEDYPKVLFVFKACAFSYLILIVSSRPQTHFKIQALINLINYTSLKKCKNSILRSCRRSSLGVVHIREGLEISRSHFRRFFFTVESKPHTLRITSVLELNRLLEDHNRYLL